MTTLFVLAILGVLVLPIIHVRYLQQSKGFTRQQATKNIELMGFGYILVAAPAVAYWVARPW
jgi:hypothetical protein